MKTASIIRLFKLLLLIMIIPLASCETFKDDSPTEYNESQKDITGTWMITKASRNGTDITALLDFSQFRITFKEDNTYTIDNYLPFLVKSAGTWSLDDPQYPFNLVFKENNTPEAALSALHYPVVDGKRMISLSFSPGCYTNIYTYVFQKVSD